MFSSSRARLRERLFGHDDPVYACNDYFSAEHESACEQLPEELISTVKRFNALGEIDFSGNWHSVSSVASSFRRVLCSSLVIRRPTAARR